MIDWLQRHMLPCAFKLVFGIDCPGCGFQRSVIALLRGNIGYSLKLYPATIPLIACCIFAFLDAKYHFNDRYRIQKKLNWFAGTVIVVFYIAKMILLYINH